MEPDNNNTGIAIIKEDNRHTPWYQRDELIKNAMAAIEEYELYMIDEVICYMPCSKRTFYNYQLHKLQAIKKALNDNKVRLRQKIRKAMLASGSATALIAMYKLVCSEDELKRIAYTPTSSNNNINIAGSTESKSFEGLMKAVAQRRVKRDEEDNGITDAIEIK